MIILGIESSCDETGAALVREDGCVLADVVSSQVKLHAPYGGVVPELASRAHMTNIVPVLTRALAPLDGALSGVDAIAVTQGPGLTGALLVGVQTAKAMALARDLPLVGVNHLIGHLLSPQLYREGEERPALELPYVALLASGGHTALYVVSEGDEIEQLGQTRDDAAGEAYDKVGKLLGLPYPGGPRVDKLAAEGDPHAVELPKPLLRRGNLDFSFSGLKTAVAQHVRKHGLPETEQGLADFCAAFQRVVVEVLTEKAVAACRARAVSRLVITGGVAANRGLRAHAAKRCEELGISLFVPPVRTCTDNAAMIAYAGARRFARGQRDGIDLDVFSRSPVLGARPGSAALRRYRSSRLPRA